MRAAYLVLWVMTVRAFVIAPALSFIEPDASEIEGHDPRLG